MHESKHFVETHIRWWQSSFNGQKIDNKIAILMTIVVFYASFSMWVERERERERE